MIAEGTGKAVCAELVENDEENVLAVFHRARLHIRKLPNLKPGLKPSLKVIRETACKLQTNARSSLSWPVTDKLPF